MCALARDDMQKEGRVRGCKDAARKVRGNMPGVSGGKALVRNDMQKEGRVRGCKDAVTCKRRAGVRGYKDAARNAMQKTGTRNRQFPNLLE